MGGAGACGLVEETRISPASSGEDVSTRDCDEWSLSNMLPHVSAPSCHMCSNPKPKHGRTAFDMFWRACLMFLSSRRQIQMDSKRLGWIFVDQSLA